MKNVWIKNNRFYFYAAWLLLSFIQAFFTPIQDDEAYYWVYSKYLAWGYFDHPPMIALLIRWGSWLFPKELGVRILPVLLNTGMLVLTEKLIDRCNVLIYFTICCSVVVLQLAGFWAVPDNPLMFFTALFFLCYRNFLRRDSWLNTFLLGLAASCLLYSKYHGLLVLLFTLFSHPGLFRKKSTYIAGVIAFLLFLPHLWWQYQHDWISFRFQLFENKAHPYQLSFTLDYLFGQLLVAGPLAGIILLVSTFAYRPANLLERALKFTVIGFFIFFFLSTLRGEVEANWTAPAIIPMLVLTHQYLQTRTKWRRWLYRLLPITITLVFFARVAMIVDLLPVPAIVERFHAWEKWPQLLKEKTKGLPVVFNNSYQRASQYWFHTGKMAYSLNSYQERRNNYNFWPTEDSLLGRPVYDLDIYGVDKYPDSIQATLWNVGFRYDSSFHSFAKIQVRTDRTFCRVPSGDSCTIRLLAAIPSYYQMYLEAHPEVDEPVKIGIFREQTWTKDVPCNLTLRQLLLHPAQQIDLVPELPKGTYFFEFAIGTDTPFFTHNSNKIRLEVE